MERKMFDDHSFESALQERVEGYRMYPSDAGWHTLYKRLHSSRGYTHILINTFLTVLLVSTGIQTSMFQHQPAPLPRQRVAGTTAAGGNMAAPLRETANTTGLSFTKPVTATVVIAPAPTSGTALFALPPESNTGELALLKPVTHNHEHAAILPHAITQLPGGNETALAGIALLIEDPERIQNADATAHTLTDKELNYEVSIPTATRIKRPVQVLFYGAPSMSYRVLIADNKITLGNMDPETQVSHAASIGWEAGVATLLPVSDRLRIRVGGQVNYTSYTVSASQGGPEVSNVMLTTSARMQRVSTLRNTNTGLPRQLANETLQLSIPVGVEYQMAGTDRLSWNIAGTLQPTYLLAATGYLVSTDYRNYFKAPDLLRRLNLNSSLETFVRFHAGKFDLQAGPQLRYMLLSNSTGIYPIREHLVDYGFKLGLIRTIR